MTPGKISNRVVADRLDLFERMLRQVRSLPLTDRDDFFDDGRNVPAAEPCLRRSLEILLDLGRHILAKGFARGVTEYQEIAAGLEQEGVLEWPRIWRRCRCEDAEVWWICPQRRAPS